MNTRHKDLDSRQVQDRVANFIASLFIFSGLAMAGLYFMAYSAIPVEAEQKEYFHYSAGSPHDSNNLQDNRPTDWWRLNSNGFSQRYVYLYGENRDERAIELLNAYDFNGEETRGMLKELAREHRIQPELFICIAYADSSLGRFLKTQHNYGNVGNNDRGDRVAFNSTREGFDAIGRYALNGRYLKHKYTVDWLSPALGKPGPYYATSPENWHINVMNCLGMIHNKYIEDNRNFRW